MEKSQIFKAITLECCKKECMKKLTFCFNEQMRTHWAGLNEQKKSEEIRKMMGALEVKTKSEDTSTIAKIKNQTSFFLIFFLIDGKYYDLRIRTKRMCTKSFCAVYGMHPRRKQPRKKLIKNNLIYWVYFSPI